MPDWNDWSANDLDHRHEVLQELWDSTVTLHDRFYPNHDIPFEARWRVFMEEVGEFLLAASVATHDETIQSDEELAKECADVIVTAMGILMCFGLTYDHLSQAIQAVIEKNDSKTHKTHEVNAQGKIARVQSNSKS